jgi:tetratricopeptide (TPR) repeat protein
VKPLVIAQEAEHELAGSVAFYEKRQSGLGLDFERAAREVLKKIASAPEDADIRNDLGLVLARRGRIPDAIDELHEALRLNPSNAAPAHANLGWALLASGKPRESIPEFEAALQLNPELKAAADGLRQAQAQLSPQR